MGCVTMTSRCRMMMMSPVPVLQQQSLLAGLWGGPVSEGCSVMGVVLVVVASVGVVQ